MRTVLPLAILFWLIRSIFRSRVGTAIIVLLILFAVLR